MDFDKELSELYPWVLQTARKYCWRLQDAEDLAGETIYKILINRDKFDDSKPLKPWCLVIMINTYITKYNHNSLIQFIGYDAMLENSLSHNTSDITTFNDILSTIHRCARKSCCIDSVIYYAKGYSYDEISRILDVPVSTVRSRISFGRKILLQELDL